MIKLKIGYSDTIDCPYHYQVLVKYSAHPVDRLVWCFLVQGGLEISYA